MLELEYLNFFTIWSCTYIFFKYRFFPCLPLLPLDLSLEYMRFLMDSGIMGRKELMFLGVRNKTIAQHYPIELAKHKRLFLALREEKRQKRQNEANKLRLLELKEQRKEKNRLRDEVNKRALDKLERDIAMREAGQSVMEYYFCRKEYTNVQKPS